MIEALCSGSAVLCANVDNMTSLVEENQGWYFKGGDFDDLADKLSYVLSHPEEVEEKKKNALLSKERFDGRKVAIEFENIYKELLEWKKNGYFVPGGEKRAKKYLRHLHQ